MSSRNIAASALGGSEADARALIENQLTRKDWQQDQICRELPRHEDEKRALGRLRPDYVLYPKDAARPIAVIEAKRPGKRLADAIVQAESYARKLKCPIVIASDGASVRTKHLGDGGALRINGEELREFPPEKTLLRFREHSQWIRGEVVKNSRGLVSIFGASSASLQKEGLANIDGFVEFSQILFFKVISELADDGEHTKPMPVHWRDIENLAGAALLRRYKEGLVQMEEHYPGVFAATQIQNPSTLEAIVAKLREYSFIDVDTDVKGEAYEYFLRRYNQQKSELAQYFTPRHVVRAMVELANPQFGEKVYDPFCGTGGMLIQAFKHIRDKIPSSDDARERRKNTSILKNRSVFGVEISRSAQTAKMNMILAGDGHSNVIRGNTLEKNADGKYDIVLTNIPFSQNELVCLRHCMDAVANRRRGRICAIVPERVIDSDSAAYVQLRKDLLRDWTVRRVVSLPREVFRGLTTAKTSIIFAEWGDGRGGEKTAPRRHKIPYFVVENDGLTLDRKRDPLPGENDLDILLEDRNEGKMCESHIAPAPNFELKPEPEIKVESDFPLRPLRELVEVHKRDVTITPDMECREPGFRGKEHRIYLRETQYGYNVGVVNRHQILPGDLVFGRMHTQDGLFAFADAEYHSAKTQLICTVRESEVDRWFLFWALDQIVPKLSMTDTTGRENYSENTILSLPIPCPPLDKQRKIVRSLREAAERVDNAHRGLRLVQGKFADAIIRK